jgi:predicted pyridoxine 5'-phosphate oxidase superfamily flavin-nucleotide-binding protein
MQNEHRSIAAQTDLVRASTAQSESRIGFVDQKVGRIENRISVSNPITAMHVARLITQVALDADGLTRPNQTDAILAAIAA